ncbi:MAG: tyrosine-protein phosphatase [Dehalococcoidia bacterium]|jgi:protein tyrosine/serine phosphatase|nr:tyrosine-protein phosphatase [Dehalococcoidia bacterium]
MTQQMERRIVLEGAVNFRDQGGYPTENGRFVKWRRLFRSDSLHDLTESDVQTITGTLGLTTIVDLRSINSVLEDGRGLLALSGIAYHNYPFLERRGIEPPTSGSDPGERLTAIYQWILLNAGTLMAQAFNALAQDVNQPALFHCNAGKDRTGVLGATLLSVLGVSREDVVADFLMTNEVIDGILARIKKMPGFQDSTRDGIMAPQSAIEKFLDVMQREFGGPESYLLRHGVQQETINVFKESMLE